MKGEKLITLIEQEMDRHAKDSNGTPETKLSWEEYLADIGDLPKPTEDQIQTVKDDIESSSLLGRSAEDGWKIVAFLASRVVKGAERTAEDTEKYGYLTYIVLDKEGNLVHAEGSGKVASILPENLLESAAIVDIPELDGMKIQLDNISTKGEKTLENTLRNCTV